MTDRTNEIAAFAKTLGTESAEQCAPGEVWEPADMLEGDWDALVEEFGELTRDEVAAAWAAYQLND